jgi:hypothetical protein
MHKPPIRITSPFILLMLIVLTSCSDDGNSEKESLEREKIDSVSLQLTAPGKAPVNLTFIDINGDGIFDPQTPFVNLPSNTAYNASFPFIGSRDGVSAKIDQKKEDHILCYDASDGILIDYMDTDSNNLPIGLTTRWFTTTPGAIVDLPIVLNHQGSLKDGDCANNGVADFQLTQRIRIMDDITGEDPEIINLFFMEIWPEPIHGADPVGVDFTDNDGDGVMDGLFQVELAAGHTFSFSLYSFAFQDDENFQGVFIEEKMDDHIICFEVTNDILVNPVPYARDKDSNELRTGLYTEWTTSGIAGKTGTLKMTLRHQPGVKTGECPGEGAVDLEAVLKIKLF